jgi:signal transduction histidine kinase
MSEPNQKPETAKNFGIKWQVSIIIVFISIMTVNFIWTYNSEQQEIIEIATEKADIIAREYLASVELSLEKFLNVEVNQSAEEIHEAVLKLGNSNKLFDDQLSLFSDYNIRMVSDRPRNKDNSPDLYEKSALVKFEKNSSLNKVYKELEIRNKKYLRYLVPLRIKEICLECHGGPKGSIDVTGYEREGYKLGELRGVVSLVIPLYTEYRHKFKHLIEVIIFYSIITFIAVVLSYMILRRMVKLNKEINEKNIMLKEQHEILVAYEEEKERLIEMIVHDLKNPLTTVTSGLDYVINSRKVSDEKLDSILKLSHSGAKRLSNMISDILDISMMEENKYTPKCSTLDFTQFMEKVCNELKLGLVDKVRSIDLKLKNEFPSFLMESSLLRRVIENIVFNAVKHSPPRQAEITISAEFINHDSEVLISISDKGEGIPAEFLDKIFDKFFQISGKGHETFNKGLGLTFCKFAIEIMGGRIWVESEPGEGSTFYFTLKSGEGCCKKDEA